MHLFLNVSLIGREIGRFKGFEGAVKSIECHPTESLLASVGLGRHLVVHDISTTKQIAKVSNSRNRVVNSVSLSLSYDLVLVRQHRFNTPDGIQRTKTREQGSF